MQIRQVTLILQMFLTHRSGSPVPCLFPQIQANPDSRYGFRTFKYPQVIRILFFCLIKNTFLFQFYACTRYSGLKASILPFKFTKKYALQYGNNDNVAIPKSTCRQICGKYLSKPDPQVWVPVPDQSRYQIFLTLVACRYRSR